MSAAAIAAQEGLRSVRGSFYLSLWNATLREVESIRRDGDPALGPHAQVYHYRVLQRLRPDKVKAEIGRDAGTALQAVRIFTEFMELRAQEAEGGQGASTAGAREALFGTLEEWLGSEEEAIAQEPTLRLLAAQMYLVEGRAQRALELVRQSEHNLEHLALATQIYLQLNRFDLARRSVAAMQRQDDDDPLTLLAQAQLQLASQAPEQLGETTYLLQDLVEKFGPSPVVLNTLAAVHIAQNELAAAFKLLREARELSIRTEGRPDPVTLVNSIVCLRRLQKDPQIIDKIVDQLRKLDPANPWLREVADAAEARFDAAAAGYQQKIVAARP